MRSLCSRYGTPIVMLNLIRQFEKQPKETILGAQLQYAVNTLTHHNFDNSNLVYITFDFLKVHSKSAEEMGMEIAMEMGMEMEMGIGMGIEIGIEMEMEMEMGMGWSWRWEWRWR